MFPLLWRVSIGTKSLIIQCSPNRLAIDVTS